jgi:phosphoribosylformylglycinamidine cyclo-ligase
MYDPTKPNTSIVIEQMKRTWDARWCKVTDGPYPIIHRIFPSQMEVDHTDGIGTKGILHWHHRTFKNAVLDALAMNINDLSMCRATPFKLQNHIVLPIDDKEAITEITTALADECVERGIAITGGETSVNDTHNGMEISITLSGWVDKVYPNRFSVGQKLIGLKSSGLHSNGFTALRHLMPTKAEMQMDWLTPTTIYKLPDSPLAIIGIQHITGGSFSKLKSKLDYDADIYINKNHKLKPHKVFYDLYQHYLHDEPMYRTFNCGIGMILGVDPRCVDWILKELDGVIIGEVTKGNGKIFVESMFSNSVVNL